MKIKKVSSLLSPLAKVLNIHSTSNQDTYSCDYINNSSVIVSPTEPIENRRKVWMQKGKNLIGRIIKGYFLDNTGGTFTESTNWFITDYIKIEPNTYYISQGISSAYKAFYDKNKKFISSDNNSPSLSPSNAHYVVMNGSIAQSSNIMLEQGSIATDYEEYIEPKTYILNDNNVYEEFVKKEENIYSTDEQVVGKWIDGKPLYRKVVTVNAPSQANNSEIIYSLESGCNIRKIDGFIITKTKNKYNINTYFTTSDFIYAYIHNDNRTIYMKIGNTAYIGSTVTLILEYTKTTD